jgi:hypothetical protein
MLVAASQAECEWHSTRDVDVEVCLHNPVIGVHAVLRTMRVCTDIS